MRLTRILARPFAQCDRSWFRSWTNDVCTPCDASRSHVPTLILLASVLVVALVCVVVIHLYVLQTENRNRPKVKMPKGATWRTRKQHLDMIKRTLLRVYVVSQERCLILFLTVRGLPLSDVA